MQKLSKVIVPGNECGMEAGFEDGAAEAYFGKERVGIFFGDPAVEFENTPVLTNIDPDRWWSFPTVIVPPEDHAVSVRYQT